MMISLACAWQCFRKTKEIYLKVGPARGQLITGSELKHLWLTFKDANPNDGKRQPKIRWRA